MQLITPTPSSRRSFLGGTAGLSAVAVAMLAGNEALAQGMGGDVSHDIGILNVALGLEYQGIAAYQLGATSGLMQPGPLKVAVLFQSQHKAHRDALIATINKLGGKPVAEKSMTEYAAEVQANTLKNQTDILELALRLELGATNAYLGVIPSFGNRDLAKVAGRIAADETMHYTALLGALGRPLPNNALSFGA